MNNSFTGNENRVLIWNILKENYGEGILYNFQNTFDDLINRIMQHKSQFSNLVEMNKALVLECSKLLKQDEAKTSRTTKVISQNNDMLDMGRSYPLAAKPKKSLGERLTDKQNEFNEMMQRELPPQIDFKDIQQHDYDGKISDLMSKQMSERNLDMQKIVTQYDPNAAKNWINNEAPPLLTIDHDKTAKIKTEKIAPRKKVTFKEDNFLNRMKKNTVLRVASPPPVSKIASPRRHEKYISIYPNKIENNILYFEKGLDFPKKLCISKLVLYNGNLVNTNCLQQKIITKISDHPFIFCNVNINGKIKRDNILLTRKSSDDIYVIYESDEDIDIKERVNTFDIVVFDKNNNSLMLSDILDITYFFRGQQLNINDETQNVFKDNKLSYIMMDDNNLKVGEKILINTELVTVIGSCTVVVKEEKTFHLESIDMDIPHNCAIIEWNVDYMGKTPTIMRVPLLRMLMTS